MERMSIILANDQPGIGAKGQRVTLELTPSQVHEASELPTYLAGYKPPGYRADEASPIILVDQDEDKYRTFNQNDAFRPVTVKGALTGPIPEVDPGSSVDTYKVVDRYIGSFIPKTIEMQASYDVRQAAARRCRRAIDLDREIDVWTLLGTTTTWDAAVRTVASNTWDDMTNGDPILDLQTAIEKSSQQVTGIWMNQKVGHAMVRNPKVREHMRQLIGDQAANSVAAALVGSALQQSVDFIIPGLPPVHIAMAKKNNAADTALEYILGDVAVLLTVPAGVPMDGEEVASCYTFRRRGPSGVGFEAREFWVEGRGPNGGTMVVVAAADVIKMTATTAGGIISNVHS
jgi:hypothetical protein